MSGTSTDGVDGVLVDLNGTDGLAPHILASASHSFDLSLRSELLALNTPGDNELHRSALAANALVRCYAEVVAVLLQKAGVPASQVQAVGAHGQTVRHRPQEFDATGYTVQINQAALLAELCGIDVVADFRSRDVAAGGQGAPLVPPFHRALFGRSGQNRAVLNIGGISNVTLLPASDSAENPVLIGFDCGPGNALMDAWCQLHTGAPFDDRGRWAAQGQVNPKLLAVLQGEEFFAKGPPKSTGRDLFNLAWLRLRLQGFENFAAQDVQATLTELTAWACAQSLHWANPRPELLLVCGGGALNDYLMERLQSHVDKARACSTAECGIDPMQVEALAFAWLAQQTVLRKTASLASVTGARGARILGAVYPA
jgi:anhydro-N-acetylmuramic acid kinase